MTDKNKLSKIKEIIETDLKERRSIKRANETFSQVFQEGWEKRFSEDDSILRERELFMSIEEYILDVVKGV